MKFDLIYHHNNKCKNSKLGIIIYDNTLSSNYTLILVKFILTFILYFSPLWIPSTNLRGILF